jgi:hypothetical protein
MGDLYLTITIVDKHQTGSRNNPSETSVTALVQTSTALLISIYVSLTAKEISTDINHRRSHRLHSEVEVLKAIAGGGIEFPREDGISKGG